MRRFWTVMCLVALLMVAALSGKSVPAHGAASTKQACKTVTKKVHGKSKKVKVCHTVKAAVKTPTPRPSNTATATPLPTSTPTTMYGSQWANGTTEWTRGGAGSWSSSGAILAYGGSGGSSFIAPYVNNQADYFVQADIQAVNLDGGANIFPSGFGIVIRAPGPVDMSAYGSGNRPLLAAGTIQLIDHHAVPNHSIDRFEAILADPNNFGTDLLYVNNESVDFNPGTDFHVYRVEVRNNDIRLIIDGHEAVGVNTNQYFSQTRVGLYSMGARLNVKDFQVGPLS
jgi:hypothetical protein